MHVDVKVFKAKERTTGVRLFSVGAKGAVTGTAGVIIEHFLIDLMAQLGTGNTKGCAA